MRTGCLLAFAQEGNPHIAFGEIAPLPAFGTEHLEQALACLRAHDEPGTREDWLDIAAKAPPACGFGIASAMAWEGPADAGLHTAKTAALLPSGEACLRALHERQASGYQRFKLKLGIAPKETEYAVLCELVEALNPADRIRLDPNRSWNETDWQFWSSNLNKLADQIEFIEEPFSSDFPDREKALLSANAAGLPIALDESLHEPGGLEKWIDRDWQGWWVLKPSLLGTPSRWLGFIAGIAERIVLSSAFETGIGMSHLIQLANGLPDNTHGFDTQQAFADTLACPQHGAELTACRESERLRIWNSLSSS